jgi:hypothetical protein
MPQEIPQNGENNLDGLALDHFGHFPDAFVGSC